MICWYGNERVALSGHALDRYRDRVRPGLDRDQVERELREVLKFAEFVANPPSWTEARTGDAAVMLANGIAFTLLPAGERSWVASTCVTVSSFNAGRRAARSASKARRRTARRLARAKWADKRRTKRLNAMDRGPRKRVDGEAA